MGFPSGTNGEECAYQCRIYVRDVGLIPGSGQSLGEGHGAWKTMSVFLPGESHGQGSLMDDSS